jgi:hypothetical protein
MPTDSAITFQQLVPVIGDIASNSYKVVPINVLPISVSTQSCLAGYVTWISTSNQTQTSYSSLISFSRDGLPCLSSVQKLAKYNGRPSVEKAVVCDVTRCQRDVYNTLLDFTPNE